MAPWGLVRVGLLTAVLAGSSAPRAWAQAAGADALAAAEAASVRGQWAQAEALYGQALAARPDGVAERRGLAFVLGEQPGRTAEAVAAYGALLAVAPRDPPALYNLAALLDGVAPRRALPAWTQYLAAATDVPAERHYVAKARSRVRELAGR